MAAVEASRYASGSCASVRQKPLRSCSGRSAAARLQKCRGDAVPGAALRQESEGVGKAEERPALAAPPAVALLDAGAGVERMREKRAFGAAQRGKMQTRRNARTRPASAPRPSPRQEARKSSAHGRASQSRRSVCRREAPAGKGAALRRPRHLLGEKHREIAGSVDKVGGFVDPRRAQQGAGRRQIVDPGRSGPDTLRQELERRAPLPQGRRHIRAHRAGRRSRSRHPRTIW